MTAANVNNMRQEISWHFSKKGEHTPDQNSTNINIGTVYAATNTYWLQERL